MKPDEETRLREALDALLERGAGGPPEERARVAGELARAGEALRAQAFRRPRDEARFVSAVLARTTREDLSWRGDLRLLGEFLRARLRASPALRLVAASLALHLVAGPALAWWMLRERPEERSFTLHIELPSELPFVDEAQVSEEPTDELRAAARAREARENERALLRRGMLDAVVGLPALAPEQGVAAAELLARHLAALRARRAPEGPALAAGEGLLVQALALELALDRRWLAGVDDDEAARQAEALAGRVAAADGSAAPVAFARSVLRRAWSEGLLELEPAPGARPFSVEWLETLAAAAEQELGAGAGPLRTWCLAAQGK